VRIAAGAVVWENGGEGRVAERGDIASFMKSAGVPLARDAALTPGARHTE
jgi:hypothetical protein